jgi:dienelactone hydrolase
MRLPYCCRLGFACAVALLAAASADARADDSMVADTLRVPIHLSPSGAPPATRTIDVAVLHRRSVGRMPFLLLLHGRAADAADRARLALPIYPANARYFAALGFVVLIPLRIGYGIAGGPDLEQTGPCDDKHFAAGVAPAVEEARQVLAFAAALSYVDSRRGIVVGESFGGLVAIAAAAVPLPGLVASLSVSGGDGGDSLRRPDRPCGPDLLAETFARYGSGNRVPTLWLYSANDRLWGAELPRVWFDAFVRAGGRGEFVELPADKNNGHFIFNRNAAAWHPAFERFVAALALP